MISVTIIQLQTSELITRSSYFFDTIHKLIQNPLKQGAPESGPQTSQSPGILRPHQTYQTQSSGRQPRQLYL